MKEIKTSETNQINLVPNKLITGSELCSILGISMPTLKSWRDKRLVKAIQRGDYYYFNKENTLDAILGKKRRKECQQYVDKDTIAERLKLPPHRVKYYSNKGLIPMYTFERSRFYDLNEVLKHLFPSRVGEAITVLNEKELYELLGVQRNTVIKWRKEGVIKATSLGAAHLYVKEDICESVFRDQRPYPCSRLYKIKDIQLLLGLSQMSIYRRMNKDEIPSHRFQGKDYFDLSEVFKAVTGEDQIFEITSEKQILDKGEVTKQELKAAVNDQRIRVYTFTGVRFYSTEELKAYLEELNKNKKWLGIDELFSIVPDLSETKLNSYIEAGTIRAYTHKETIVFKRSDIKVLTSSQVA
ncbi:helix-turn-helix domain-containing protein [Sediminitomix flava]|uniref:Uncharacterized protein n=1 Tax=Sediminitomix flava TaxID=379075 RepID=A0A315ZFE5_SEDFL|nr:helix-turn-helix domain-containing protein [Sediminitomix flava]PWJ43879.1 hypothetical protein BC781_101225 [Sediminitomix flava]